MDRRIVGFLSIGAILIALPFLLPVYGLHLAVTAILWVMLALSFNILLGDLGELSFGHAAFYGIGAYASALATMRLGLPVPAGIVFGVLVSALLGFLVGVPAFQTKGHYFALVTMGFGQLAVLVMISWENLTGGAVGLRNVPPLGLGTELTPVYFAFLAICVLVIVFVYRLRTSHIGEAFDAIREDSILAEHIGIPTKRYKLLGITFSSAIAGLAGALMAHFFEYISPNQFDLTITLDIALMTLIGGAGTMWGPVVGAIFLHLLPEALHGIDQYRLGAFGLIMMLVIIFLPGGLASLVGQVRKTISRRTGKQTGEGTEARTTVVAQEES